MDNKDNQSVSYLAFESSQARMERTNKRQFVLILVLIIALLGTNAGWIFYESQFEEVVTNTQTVTQETDGGNNTFTGDFTVGE